MRVSSIVVLGLCVSAGCGGDRSVGADAGNSVDSGPTIDSGPAIDGGATDDAAVADASSVEDARRPPVDAGPCTDDDSEPNDTMAAAMASGEIYGAMPVNLSGRVSCPGNVDFYYAYADCCTTAGASIQWNEADGQIDVALLDESGAVVTPDSDVYVTGDRSLNMDEFGGRFFVRVTNESNTPVTYDLIIRAMVFL